MNQFEFNLEHKIDSSKKKIIVLGKFFGFHLGHQELLKKAKHQAIEENKDLIVMMYPQNDKQEFFFSQKDRLKLIAQYDPQYIMFFPPTLKNYRVSREQFCAFLVKNLNVSDIYIGHNFNFGKNKSDDFIIMQKFANLVIIKNLKFNNSIISTSKIIELLKDGNVYSIKKLLGFNWFYDGKIIYGQGNGKKMNVPTANVDVSPNLIVPRLGAYISNISIDGMKYPSMSSIMDNPYFNAKKITFETHLLDQDLDLYGKTAYVELIKFIHEPVKWNSIEDGLEMLKNDKRISKKFFKEQI